MKNSFPFISLFLITLFVLNISATVIDSGGVEISPTQVNLVSNLRVFASITNTIPQNGSIVIVFPQQIIQIPQSTNCRIIVPNNIPVVCSYQKVSNLVQVKAIVSLEVKDTFNLEIPGFTNPSSTAETDSFQLFTYNSAGTGLDQQTDSIILQATRGSLASVILTPSSQIIGDSQNDLTVTLRVTNPVPQNGKIKLKFPFWNPDASITIFKQLSFILNPTNVQCIPKTTSPMKTSVTCIFDQVSQTLTVTNIFSTPVISGTQLAFTIKDVRNPVSATPVSNIEVYTVDDTNKDGIIDWAQGTLTATTPGRIATSAIKLDSTLVQDLTQYRLEFLVPVPLSAGCIIEIIYPQQIQLGAELTQVTAFGMPNAQRTLTGQIDRTRNSYVITNACPQYRDNTNQAIIIFKNIRNTFYQVNTDPIEILISDSGQRLVCTTNNNGPRVQFTAGTMKVDKLVTELTTEINQAEVVTFSIQPFHALSQNCQILIKLPNEFSVIPSAFALDSQVDCQYIGISPNMPQIVQSCQYTIVGGVKQIIINNALIQDYFYEPTSSVIKFKIYNMKLPPSEAPIGNFEFTVSSFYNGQYYPVDLATAPLLFQASRAALGSGWVVPASYIANQITDYTFYIQVNNPLLRNGYLVLRLPSEISIPNLQALKCVEYSNNFQATPSCQANSTHITVRNANPNSDLTKDKGPLVLKISGFRNPRSLKSSSSFTVNTFDSQGYMIEFKNDQITVTMTETPKIQAASVTSSSKVVGGLAIYSFQITPSTALVNGDQITIQFPDDYNVPLANTVTNCAALSGLTSISCKPQGNFGLFATLGLPNSLSGSISIGFNVQLIQNPTSTRATGLFNLNIADQQGFSVNTNNPQLTTFNVRMSQGAQFSNITVFNQIRRANVMTAITFTFKSDDTPIPVNAVFQITYPDQLTADQRFAGCVLSNKNPSTQCDFDIAKNIITVSNVTDIQIEAGTVFSVTLYGLINSKFAKATDSFEFEIYTSTGNLVLFTKTGLTVSVDCDYPCLSCNRTLDPSKCLTCDIQSDFKLFLNNQCLTKCPSNYYPAEFQCKRCDPNCMECADGGTKCTKCNKDSFLQGNTCVKQCRAGVEYQNILTQNCEQCQSPCETCSISTTQCDSCLQTVPQNLNYMYKCLTECPANVTVVQDTRCVNCSQNCKTCNKFPNICTSCYDGFKLDVQDTVCKTSCPLGTSVETNDRCLPCDLTCKTCSGTNTSHCLTCQPGLSHYPTQQSCLLTCPNRTVQVTQQGVRKCLDCAPGCAECQNKTTYCTKCDLETHVFYKFTCVPGGCPKGYKRISDLRNVCVKEREDCKYGYAYNDFGECALVAQKCEPGYVLNEKLNRCIPVPGFYIPFLFLGLAIAWTIYVYVQYRKGKVTDRYMFIIQCLFGYTHIQTATYFIMFCLSIALDYKLIQALHLFCLFLMLLTNLGFTFFLHLRQRKNDTALRHWCDDYAKEYKYLRWVMMAFSFKTVRVMYSRVLPNKPYMNVPFDTQYSTLIKPLFFTTVINFIMQAGPIFLMNAYMLMFISWGYQLMVMSIDNMILAFVIFVLEILEFSYFKRCAIDDKQLIYSKPGGPKKEDGIRVFGGYYEDDGMGPGNGGAIGPNDDSQLIYLNENKYRLERMGALTQEEVRAIETMYMTKDGYKKKLMIDSQANDSYRQTDSQFPKYLDPEQISLSALKGRKSHAPQNSGKSREAMVLENIVKRLQEEKKFNYLQSEPSASELINDSQPNHLNNLLDSETRALIGNTDATKLMTEQEKSKLRMETARERIESRLSFRRTQLHSHQKVVDQRIAEEMSKAIFDDQGRVPEIVLETQEEEPLNHPTQSVQQQVASVRNLDSARTEKYNHVGIQGSPSRNVAPIISTTERAPQPPVAYLSGGLNDPQRLIQRDKRDFAIYFRDIKRELKLEHRERQGRRKRDWHSFDEQLLRDPWDNEVERETHFDEQLSYESYPPRKVIFKNPEYMARLELFRQNIKPLNQFGNVYTQQNDPDLIAKRRELNQKNVTRRTQTYERDIGIGYDPFDHEGDELLMSDDRGDRGLEYDPRFAQEILRNLIDNLSEFPSSGDENNDRFDRNKKITRENFELDDILGTFDIDDNGNIILDLNKLTDNLGRRVNKHGYLVDKKGNILSQQGDILFSYKELEDEDLPQPYRFEKRRRHLLRHKDVKYGMTIEGAEARRLFDIDAVMANEDDQIEEEFNKLREMSRPSSVDSLIGVNNAQVKLNEVDEAAKRLAQEEEERKRLEELDNDRRQREMAKAYGGKPPAKKPKKKKKRRSPGGRGPQTLEDIRGPPTDRLYQGFLAQEEERVKKIARVAYRQQKADDGSDEPTDDVGFQEFFKQQMDEIRQQRETAKEDHQKSQAIYTGVAPLQNDVLNHQAIAEPEIYTGFDSEQTALVGQVPRQTVPLPIESSMSTNRANIAPFWNPTQSQSPEKRVGGARASLAQQIQNPVDEDAETLDGGLRQRVDTRSASNERSQNPNPSSAFTIYQNLQFNHKSHTSVPEPYQNLASTSSLSNVGQPGGGGGFFGGNPIQSQQPPLRQKNETQQQQPYSFYNQPAPNDQLDQLQQFTLADQSETLYAHQQQQQPTSGWKKFDFYLPNKNPRVNLKKDINKNRDLNFSEVGQMQIQGAMGNSRIRDLEKLYLQKYPGHVTTVSAATNIGQQPGRGGPQVQFNQYVNTQGEQKVGAQRAVEAKRNTLYDPPSSSQNTSVVAGMSRKKGISAMRGTYTVVSTDLNQTQSTIQGASVLNQRSNSNHNQRPQSSFTNVPGRQFGLQGVLQTVNSTEGGAPDVFDGVARVLNNIERLKGSSNAGLRHHLDTSAELNTSNPNDETGFPGSSQGGWL